MSPSPSNQVSGSKDKSPLQDNYNVKVSNTFDGITFSPSDGENQYDDAHDNLDDTNSTFNSKTVVEETERSYFQKTRYKSMSQYS